ncbi:MAG: HAD-IA family hydrolase [Pseudomonadota bacterium]
MHILVNTLIFDLDGTLVDSLADIALAINQMRNELGLAPLKANTVLSYIGDGARELVSRALHGEVADLKRALDRFILIYQEHICDQTQLMPGVIETLERFSEKNLAIVTNKPSALTEDILQKLKIKRYFQLVLGSDSTKNIKPHPEPILKTMEHFHVTSQKTIMIGDHHTDIKAGKAAGVWTCFVKGFGKIEDSEPDVRIDNLAGLELHIH